MPICFKNRFLGREMLSVCVLCALFLGLASFSVNAGVSLGLQADFVLEKSSSGAFPLVQKKQAATIYADKNDSPSVLRAAGDLQADVERVTGVKPNLVTDAAPSKTAVIVGTIGKSALIDDLVKSGKIKGSDLSGKWESFVITVVDKPMSGVDKALVVAGSDRRGVIYGMYEISEQIGVSPWYWWADVPVKKHDELFIKAGTYTQGPPVVKYRGIFINDEDPCLGGWSRAKFGGVNSKMYAHMFELILRLRGNYLWPAMWGKSLTEDDLETPKVADLYGVVVGSSHHEPLMRAQKDWEKAKKLVGNGEWDYGTNEAGLKAFWTEGVRRNKNYECLMTTGMRGDGDVGMKSAGSIEGDVKMLEKIFADQREIIKTEMNTDPAKVPQLWALFTEVQKFYDAGVKVPDDITLLFCDDNVGNLRRLPTPEERKRSGGAGIYFHMDMNGGPFSYKWLNSNPLPKVWEQMNLAVEYGATRIWITNVGDLKPLEVPLEFIIRLGWDPKSFNKDNIHDWTLRWAEREFGKTNAKDIADLVEKYAKYNAWRKSELIRPNTYSLVNYGEAERVLAAWNELVIKAEKIEKNLPKEQKDAYYQLVLHPVKACANFNELYVAAGRNELFAKQKRASANAEAARVRDLFDKDQKMSDNYNKELAGGKWDHMMDQTHIGYTGWQSPQKNIMPKLTELQIPDANDFGVAVDGSDQAWPGSSKEAALPTFDSLNPKRSYFEIFARGSQPAKDVKFTADQPWIQFKEEKAPNAGKDDRRVWVTVDWKKISAAGEAKGMINITGGSNPVAVKVTALKASDAQVAEAKGCYGSLAGPIAFWAEGATKNTPVNGVRWDKVPDLGRGPSGMTIFPVTAPTMDIAKPVPTLEYQVYFARSGNFQAQLICNPTLDTLPGRKLSVAVCIDDAAPQVYDIFTPEKGKDETFLGRNHFKNAGDNARVISFNLNVDKPGKHTFKIKMVDSTMVVQKIVLNDGPLPASYFGPLEMSLNGAVSK